MLNLHFNAFHHDSPMFCRLIQSLLYTTQWNRIERKVLAGVTRESADQIDSALRHVNEKNLTDQSTDAVLKRQALSNNNNNNNNKGSNTSSQGTGERDQRWQQKARWDHSAAMGQRQAYGLGRNSTRHLRRISCQQHSGQTRCSGSQSSTEQDGQVHQVGQHPHLLSVCHRNSRCVAWDSHRSDAGDWQTHHGCHWGHQETESSSSN